MMPQLEIKQPIIKPREYFNLKQWRAQYRLQHRELINNTAREEYKANKDAILRRHLLWNLNKSKNTEKPKQISIDKYNLKYDENFKRWI